MEKGQTPFLRVEHLSKTFNGNTVLSDISLSIAQGEFHALVGENGAGKSTFINLVSGIIKPDEGGIIEIDGRPSRHLTPKIAQDSGISVIHQELSLCRELTISQNVFLGRELITGLKQQNTKEMDIRTSVLLKMVHLDYLRPSMPVGKLSLAEQQLVEFAKAINQNPRMLILDEVTSALAPEQVKVVFAILKDLLRKKGLSVIFISHRMPEIFELCSKVTVLKDGIHVITKDLQEINNSELVNYMTGRQILDIFPPKKDLSEIMRAEVVYAGEKISANGIRNIDFQLHKGEILGIGGLQGQGQDALVEVLYGVRRLKSGTLYLKGKRLKLTHPKDAVKHHIAYIPAERKTEGVFLPMSIRGNIGFLNFDKLTNKLGFVLAKKENDIAWDNIQKFNIKTWGAGQSVISLSGGNQQKVVLAKWLARNPEIIILNDPTRGIDVGTKKEIYDILRALAADGIAIILNSSDTMELIGLCDRIIVLYENKINAILEGADITENKLVYASCVEEEIVKC